MGKQAADSTHPVRVLAGDIGGTKTRLAVFDVHGTRLETVAEQTFHSRDHASLDDIVAQFLTQHSSTVEAAGFGIAGPVRHNEAHTTNLPWHISATELGQRFSIAPVVLLNDLEANAWGIRALSTNDFVPLQAGGGDTDGNCAIIAAGTGLGEAGMYHDAGGLHPFATEGGHTDFSPGSALEIELLRFLQQRYRHVSWERVLSGPGLVNLHDFLRHYHHSEVPGWLADEMQHGDPAAAISLAGQSGRDTLCAEALGLFVHLYGVEAGNLALKVMATGGLYLGGGIAPKILPALQDGSFLRAFLAKGRMQSVLERVPVQVILNDRTALYGPALCAAQRTAP